MVRMALTLVVGLVGYLIAKKLKFPAPAMVGSMIAVGAYNVLTGEALMPASLKTFTQGIAGMFIGLRMSKDDFSSVKHLAEPIIILCLFFTVNTIVVGLLMTFLCDMDLMTALLSCVAGGVTDMSLLAIDMGADASIVAIMHTIRLVTTLLIFPSWIGFFTKDEPDVESTSTGTVSETEVKSGRLKSNIISVLLAFGFGYLGKLVGIPAGSLVFSAIGMMVLHWYLPMIRSDKIVKTVGQLFAGSIVGATVSQATIDALPGLLVPVLLLVASYWLVNILYGKLLQHLKLLDLKTAMFAACPAGASDMALIAGDMGADLSKIGLIQVVRLIFSVAVMPQIITIFVSFF